MTPMTKQEYQRNWRRERREAWMDGKECGNCGSTDDLHIHHRDPEQKVDHRLWSWSAERRALELAKCDVLCGDCHREHHRRLDRKPCGTEAAYKKGCRCPMCRQAHTAAARLAPRRPPKPIEGTGMLYRGFTITADTTGFNVTAPTGDAFGRFTSPLVARKRIREAAA